MPRGAAKFTVGDRLIETCLDITSALLEASFRRDKYGELAAASRALVRARLLVRLARALHSLSEAQHQSGKEPSKASLNLPACAPQAKPAAHGPPFRQGVG